MIQSEATRAYIYRVIVALISVLIVLGAMSGEDAQMYLNLAAAVLGLGSAGLATKNTSRHPDA